MHPALSIIVFTVVTGLAYGWLALALLLDLVRIASWHDESAFLVSIAVALTLLVVGLLSFGVSSRQSAQCLACRDACAKLLAVARSGAGVAVFSGVRRLCTEFVTRWPQGRASDHRARVVVLAASGCNGVFHRHDLRLSAYHPPVEYATGPRLTT